VKGMGPLGAGKRRRRKAPVRKYRIFCAADRAVTPHRTRCHRSDPSSFTSCGKERPALETHALAARLPPRRSRAAPTGVDTVFEGTVVNPSSSEISRASGEVLRSKHDARARLFSIVSALWMRIPHAAAPSLDDKHHPHVVARKVADGLRNDRNATQGSKFVPEASRLGASGADSAREARASVGLWPAGKRGEHRPQAMHIIRIDPDVDRHGLLTQLAQIKVALRRCGVQDWVQPQIQATGECLADRARRDGAKSMTS